MVEHRLSANALPVENAIQRLTVRNMNGNHGEVCERRDASLKGLEVEGRLYNNYRWAPLFILVSREQFVQRFVNLLQINFYADLERVF